MQSFRQYLRISISSLCVLVLVASAYFLLQPSDPIQIPGREIRNSAELQIALARNGFSPGSIDGVKGKQSRQALIAYQLARGLDPTGVLDEATKAYLKIEEPIHAEIEITEATLSAIDPRPQSWIERGQRARMAYNSVLELVAEKTQSDPDYIRTLNPGIDWNRLRPGDRVRTPSVGPFRISQALDHILIRLEERTLTAVHTSGETLFHCPVSIARNVNKRPRGELRVKVRVADPNYTFNPAILSATAASEGITQKFIIQPGPNNPVGSVWIGLNRPSYGIHGTPEPEKVGRTESSGCFRLANWNAETLLEAVEVGTIVIVQP